MENQSNWKTPLGLAALILIFSIAWSQSFFGVKMNALSIGVALLIESLISLGLAICILIFSSQKSRYKQVGLRLLLLSGLSLLISFGFCASQM